MSALWINGKRRDNLPRAAVCAVRTKCAHGRITVRAVCVRASILLMQELIRMLNMHSTRQIVLVGLEMSEFTFRCCHIHAPAVVAAPIIFVLTRIGTRLILVCACIAIEEPKRWDWRVLGGNGMMNIRVKGTAIVGLSSPCFYPLGHPCRPVHVVKRCWFVFAVQAWATKQAR